MITVCTIANPNSISRRLSLPVHFAKLCDKDLFFSQLYGKHGCIAQVNFGRVPGIASSPGELRRLSNILCCILSLCHTSARWYRTKVRRKLRCLCSSPLSSTQLPRSLHSYGIRAYTAALRFRVKRFDPTRAINPFRVHGEHVYPAKLETNVHHRLGLKRIWRHCPQEVAVEIVFAQRHACGAVADLEDFKYLEDAGNLR